MLENSQNKMWQINGHVASCSSHLHYKYKICPINNSIAIVELRRHKSAPIAGGEIVKGNFLEHNSGIYATFYLNAACNGENFYMYCLLLSAYTQTHKHSVTHKYTHTVRLHIYIFQTNISCDFSVTMISHTHTWSSLVQFT